MFERLQRPFPVCRIFFPTRSFPRADEALQLRVHREHRGAAAHDDKLYL